MNPFQVIVTAVLTTLTVLALGVVATWSLWPAAAEASAIAAGHSGAWHGGSHDHCERLAAEHIEFGEAVVTVALQLDDRQRDALAKVAGEIEAWRSQAQATCANLDLASLDGGLAGLENLLTLSARAMGELRPAVNAFYDSLSAAQQDKLRGYMHAHHGGDRHGFSRHHNHG